MPSIQNPAFYDRADSIAPGRSDDFIKWIDQVQYLDTTGDVESPVGWVGLIKIHPDLIAEYAASMGDPWITERRNFEPGWYIVRQDEFGMVFAMVYGGLCWNHDDFCTDTMSEQNARADFGEAESVYATWIEEKI